MDRLFDGFGHLLGQRFLPVVVLQVLRELQVLRLVVSVDGLDEEVEPLVAVETCLNRQPSNGR